MSKAGELRLGANPRLTNPRTLKTVIDSALDGRSGLSILLTDSTIGVSLDTHGDWTISIGLSLKSDRFHSILVGLESIGFFHATENEGTSYFLWTSLLTMAENARTVTEQILAQAVNVLQAAPVSQYIS